MYLSVSASGAILAVLVTVELEARRELQTIEYSSSIHKPKSIIDMFVPGNIGSVSIDKSPCPPYDRYLSVTIPMIIKLVSYSRYSDITQNSEQNFVCDLH